MLFTLLVIILFVIPLYLKVERKGNATKIFFQAGQTGTPASYVCINSTNKRGGRRRKKKTNRNQHYFLTYIRSCSKKFIRKAVDKHPLVNLTTHTHTYMHIHDKRKKRIFLCLTGWKLMRCWKSEKTCLGRKLLKVH